MYRLSRVLQGFLATFLFASVALAGTTGKIAGRVTDAATGEPLPGVQIMIEETRQGTVTDVDGYYSIINIKPGTYTLVFKYVGFADRRVQGVQVVVDKTTTIDAQLREQAIEGEEVVVTAERPLVEVDRTTTTSFVDEDQLEALPVTGVGDVVNLQAGVVDGHFRGGRGGEVAYMINGVPVNNPFNNSASIEVEKNMISGLEVISGVFGAEYGQAMSGVVNIVTKDVPRAWTGSFSGEVGGIASGRKTEYIKRNVDAGAGLNTSDFTSEMVPYYKAAGLLGRQDYQVSLGGPLLRDKLGFQFTGRFLHTESHIIGRRLFLPSDSSQGLSSGASPDTWIIESSGDQDFVPGYHERYSLNGTLVYNISPYVKAEYNLMLQDMKGRDVPHERKYVPDGVNPYYGTDQFHLLGLHFTLGSKSFANVNYSYLRDSGGSRLYDVPSDFDQTGQLSSEYVPPRLSSLQGQNAFMVGGNDLYNSESLTETHTVLADYTNQINRVHQIKTGVSARLHHLDNGSYGIEVGPRTGWIPMPSIDRYGRDTLQTRPYELAAYIQDKMEYKNLIVNAGLRFDYFQPDFQIPVDWTQAQYEYIPDLSNPGDSLYNRKAASVRYQLSPRFGIAFPISSTGVIRFSAGLFFQIPQLSMLYQNPEFEVNPVATTVSFGNPNIDPERTLHFEIGLQQGLTSSLGMELTLFSKDIRNLVGVEYNRDVATTSYFIRYINRDVGTSRGVTLSLFQRPTNGLSWDLDYTLQFAEGTSSNPGEAFARFQAGLDDILVLSRLDWDRRHVLTNSITLAPTDGFSLTMINRFQTGSPYTTVRQFVTSYIENNADAPTAFFSDLRLFYRPPFIKDNLQLSLQVENVFDAKVHYGVFSDTGRADESVSMELYRRNGTQVGGLNSLDEYFIGQGRFSSPRRVIVGLRYSF